MNASTFECGSRFQQFVHDLQQAVRQPGLAEPELLQRAGASMKNLLATDDWLPEAFTKPHPVYYQQYLLHADPQNRFSVVSFVWGPGQSTPIHDHLVWGVIGVLRGGEIVEDFDVSENGKPVQRSQSHRLDAGQVGFVSPTIGDVHRVSNAFSDQVSVSIHAYGGNIGTINRHVYSPVGEGRKTFVSGYANTA